ncbi:MAG TPA: S1 RNA-binding domain-containing protein [Candidatus Bathyarchaeia archaeon]|nr:S1 RNA-binding domain-containing protein [Candidatus Bathyarchaeia archaeon]
MEKTKNAKRKVKSKKKQTKPAKKTTTDKRSLRKKTNLRTSKKAPAASLKLLSTKEPQTMEELFKATGYQPHGLKKGTQLEGTITDVSKRAVLVDIGAKTEGMVIGKSFEAAQDFIDQLKVGEKISVIVLSPENDKGQILLSLKQAASDYKWNHFEQYLKTGEAVEVRGLEVNRGGLIVRVLGVRGFVPASQLGRKYLGKPEELQNKLFKAKVIEVDREKNRLIFSEKQISEAEALAAKQEALKKVKIGQELSGKVSGIMPFGIFVQIEDKDLFLEGLVHISEISWERVEDLNRLFKVGQKIKVKVLEIDKVSGRLNLSLKQLTEDPWQEIAKKYKPEKKVKAKVSRLVAFGAFVELEPGVEGLIHISKIPAEYNIKAGDKIDIYVETVDTAKRRMSLGLVLKEKPVGYK